MNYALGKWDHTPLYEVSQVGPFDRWPSGEGFQHAYTFMAADVHQFVPVMWIDHTRNRIASRCILTRFWPIARTPRRLLIKITGFTVAHSITLALSALDVVRIPTPPVEAAIALSVVFMAWEIVKGDETSLAHRFPVAVSSSFGLLHGLGFAAVLRDIGLPQTELPTALLFFNIGVEIGQILFVSAFLTAFFVLRPIMVRLLQSARDGDVRWSTATVPASYLIGSVASYWMIDRIAGFWA